MAHLIDKDTIVAEIEYLKNTYKECPTRNSYEEGLKDGRLIGYIDALDKINSLEVKEVDLNNNIEKACSWLEEIFSEYENLTDYNPMNDFKKYMKGE